MKRWIAWMLALACACSLSGCTKQNNGNGVVNTALRGFALETPEYPQMAQYPDETAYFSKTGAFDSEGYEKVYTAWREDRRARQDQPAGYADGLDGFFQKSIRKVLSGGTGENKVYSPLNVFMALSMLAEVTDGNSRRQILDLLGADSIERLRTQAKAVWNANYCNDGAVTSILASSLWLNKDVGFVQSTMDSLAQNYYAASFQGEMGATDFNEALQTWLNEQTGGLLKEQASGLSFTPETIMAIATTIYYRAKWAGEFSENSTDDAVFHAPGGDFTCDFMHQGGTCNYYWSDRFSAVSKRLEGSGNMWFILPDEGVTPEELLLDGKTMDFILADGDWENSKFLIVNLALPKFDVVSDADLIPSLREMGLTDIFNPAVSDFTPMTTDMDEIVLSQAKHAARVAIDEEGVIAAAYTVMMADGTAMPPEEEIDFVVDRPFLFAITSPDALPLFVGVVNQPV